MVLRLSPLASTSLPSSAGGLKMFQSILYFIFYYSQKCCKNQRRFLQHFSYLQCLIKSVADSPYCLYVNWLAGIILYFLPYIMDMAHDDVVIAGIWLFPNTIIYLLFAKYYVTSSRNIFTE